MTTVRFYDVDFIPRKRLIYSIICVRFSGKWIFVRHRTRATWEIPGGHIENDESPDEAAFREVKEETGAIEFDLDIVACVGCCTMAPVTVVDDKPQAKVEPTKVDGILLSFEQQRKNNQ